MEQNPYEAPQPSETSKVSVLSGRALAKDTVSLLFFGVLASVVVVPVLFIVVAVAYGILQFIGLPLPNP